MRRREYYWSIFHSKGGNQLDGLRTDQVEAVFSALPKLMHKEWLIWRDGFEDWKPFEDFPQLMISLRKVDAKGPEAPPPPSSKVVGKKSSFLGMQDSHTEHLSKNSIQQVFEEEGQTGDLSLVTVGNIEDRNNFRFEKKYAIRIFDGDHVYENKTVNISLKGMQLQNPLPQGLPQYINVEIIYQDQIVPVVCSEIRGQANEPVTRLKFEVNDYSPRLLAILLSS